MEEKIMIYVAGNPEAYPVEYYDSRTDTYQGVIPQLFQEFSNQSDYEITYYQADGKDYRESCAQNKQVDILSGYMTGEQKPDGATVQELFYTTQNGQRVTYNIYFTGTEPEGFMAEWKEYISAVSQERISGLLIDTALYNKVEPGSHLTVYVMGFIIIILVCTILFIVRKGRKRLRKMSQYLETDEITGVGNSEYFARKFNLLTNNKTKTLYQVVYFYVDIDRLYRMCNSPEVDLFMQFCAKTLLERVFGNEVLAKVSDNGFAVLKFMGNSHRLDQWIADIFASVHMYAVEQGRPFDLSLSAGIYEIKETDRNLKEILYNAMECAQMARREQKKYLICSEEILCSVMQERYLQESMNRAFEEKEFQLFLQFYVDAGSFHIVGGEALSRWNHPQRGMIMPNVFVPLMEHEKMISRLDYYCLERVCEFLEALKEKGVESFFVSCNFSRETISAVDFAERSKKIIETFHFPKELLIFEITESEAVKSVTQVQRNIIEIKKLGVKIALDDFGEGFTSFYDIQQYPIDGVKLDKGLIDDIMTPSGNAIVRAMIQVGHELGMTILAEGVETEEQVQALQKMNCDVIQGFRFFVPLPDWDAEKRILESFRKR